MHINIIILALLISGCSHVVTKETYSQKLAGKCFELLEDVNVYGQNYWFGVNYLVITNESIVYNSNSMKNYNFTSTLKKGEIIKIQKIINQSWGTTGSCWDVYVTNRNLQDIEFKIPSCALSNNNEWVKPPPWERVNGESLRIETEYLSDSRECTHNK